MDKHEQQPADVDRLLRRSRGCERGGRAPGPGRHLAQRDPHGRGLEQLRRRPASRRDDEGPGFWEALKDLFLPDEDRATYAEGLAPRRLRRHRSGERRVLRARDRHPGRRGHGRHRRALRDLAERRLERDGLLVPCDVRRRRRARPAGIEQRHGLRPRPACARRPAWATHRHGRGATDFARRLRIGPFHDRRARRRSRSSRRSLQRRQARRWRAAASACAATSSRRRFRSRSTSARSACTSSAARPIAPLTGSDNAFQDRTIEVEEKSEEAVISKDARVKEELVVKKDVEQRTETVSDTVRRTEVEVEDDRGRTAGTGTTGTSTDRDR